MRDELNDNDLTIHTFESNSDEEERDSLDGDIESSFVRQATLLHDDEEQLDFAGQGQFYDLNQFEDYEGDDEDDVPDDDQIREQLTERRDRLERFPYEYDMYIEDANREGETDADRIVRQARYTEERR